MPDILQHIQDAYNGNLDCTGCDLERFAPTPSCLSCGKYGELIRTRNKEMLALMPELMSAISEGGVVELPCKVGDTVYWFWIDGDGNPDGDIQQHKIYEFGLNENGLYISIDPYDGYLCHVKDIGKVSNGECMVFLTESEARKAYPVLRQEYEGGRTLTRKRFVKLMMANGYQRNDANGWADYARPIGYQAAYRNYQAAYRNYLEFSRALSQSKEALDGNKTT